MKATGERWERRLWREERLERAAAVDRRGRLFKADEDVGHRNRNHPSGRGSCYNNTKVQESLINTGLSGNFIRENF